MSLTHGPIRFYEARQSSECPTCKGTGRVAPAPTDTAPKCVDADGHFMEQDTAGLRCSRCGWRPFPVWRASGPQSPLTFNGIVASSSDAARALHAMTHPAAGVYG